MPNHKIFIIISMLSLTIGSFCFASVPNDVYYSNQWYLKSLGLESVWDKTTGSREVVVAVIDSGVEIAHEDLHDNIWVNRGEIDGDHIDNDHNGYIDDIHGWDFFNNDNNPSPSYTADCGNQVCLPEGINHGTLVSGIIGAIGNNLIGVTGVNWQVKIMPLRILQQSGLGDTQNIVDAINYAVNNGADVINMSFVGDQNFVDFRTALQNAYNRGVIIIAASGNSDGGTNLNLTPDYPVCYIGDNNEDIIIGVGSSDKNNYPSSFSNYGDNCVDVLAPGEEFFGTTVYDPKIANLNTLYDGYYSGTSMAAAVVSGLSALIKSYDLSYTNKHIRDLIYSTASYSPSLSGKVRYGQVDPSAIFSSLGQSSKLIKGSLPAVYYLGADGKRYVFPDQNTYYSWYANFASIRTIPDAQLAGIALGGNVTIRPGAKLVKITSDTKVYAVSRGGVLHWITTETLVQQIYGGDWLKNLVDISDAFFVNYKIGSNIYNVSDYNRANELAATLTIDQDKGF